jgi:hypothetical protein
MERRGIRTEVGWRMREEANERLQLAAELGRIERERQATERSILDLSGDVAAARHDRDAGLTTEPDLEFQRRAGREAWLAWRANSQDQLEHGSTTHIHRPRLEAPDDDFGLD